MPFPRVGGLSVTLPNGEMIIMNGAKRGMGNDYLRDPVRTAVINDPDARSGQRYRAAATTNMKRLCHNVASLLPNGNVLVAGGEQGEAYPMENGGPWCGTNYDYEFQAKIYKPPYVFEPEKCPIITDMIGGDHFGFGETIRVYFESSHGMVNGATVTSPNAVTHGTEMNISNIHPGGRSM